MIPSQIDGKVAKASSGLGGAYCHMCTATEAEGRDPDRVQVPVRSLSTILFLQLENKELSC